MFLFLITDLNFRLKVSLNGLQPRNVSFIKIHLTISRFIKLQIALTVLVPT